MKPDLVAESVAAAAAYFRREQERMFWAGDPNRHAAMSRADNDRRRALHRAKFVERPAFTIKLSEFTP